MEGSETEETVYTPLVSANVANLCFDAIFSDQRRYIQTTVQVTGSNCKILFSTNAQASAAIILADMAPLLPVGAYCGPKVDRSPFCSNY